MLEEFEAPKVIFEAPKVVKVKRNHIMAAKLMIERYERGVGPKPSAAVIAIANAKPKAVVEEVDDEQASTD